MKTPEIQFNFPNVLIDGRVIGLRKREFELLRYMYEARGAILRPYDIYKDVWNFDVSVIRIKNDSAIRTALSRIKTAIPDVLIARAPNLGWVLV